MFLPKHLTAIQTLREDDFLNDSALSATSNFTDEEQVKTYIQNFISNTSTGKALGYTDVDSTLKRIQAIPNLKKLIKFPIMLMITMHVLPYLEAFYQEKPQSNEEVLNRDLMHFFTIVIIEDMAHAIYLQNNRLDCLGRLSTKFILLEYNRSLAKLMNSDSITEIKQEELVSNGKIKHYRKYFHPVYDSTLFKDAHEHQIHSLGYHYGPFVKSQGQHDKFRHSFIHPIFLDYFAMLPLQTTDKNSSRAKIENFLKYSSTYKPNMGVSLEAPSKSPIWDPGLFKDSDYKKKNESESNKNLDDDPDELTFERP